MRQFCIGAVITLALGITLALLWKPAMNLFRYRYITGPRLLFETCLLPLLFVVLGWTVMCGMELFLKAKPLDSRWAKYGRWTVFGILVLVFALMLPHSIWFVRDCLLDLYVDGLNAVNGRHSAFAVRPLWVNRVIGNLWVVIHKRRSVFLLFGVLLWVFGFPKRKESGKREKLWLCAAAGLCLGLALYAAAEREYVLTLEPGTQAEKPPFRVEIKWQEEVIIE